KKKQQNIENSIESKPRNTYIEPTTVKDEMKSLWRELIKTSKTDALGTGTSFTEQVFGVGDFQLAEGEAVNLKAKKKQEEEQKKAEKKPVASEHMEYFRTVNHADRIGESSTEREVRQAVEQIRMEIQKLAKTSKLVERTVKDATADQAPVKPGRYHLNFFEFVLNIIRDANSKLQDSVSYGAVLTGKKQQSKYWNQYKTQGTSFGLSGERSSATQTG
ncbi:MAG TPA: DUF5660 family protein, partial [Patescibacteria group bacterium]|nr:DUF5660 family protein [Patescibacteria group bacterium]